MIMADVFAVFGTLLAMGIAFPGMLLTWRVLLPKTVYRAQTRLAHTPWRCLFAGGFLILVSTILGGPIFAALGGIAVLLFMADGISPAAVPLETYRLSVSPFLPAIPLFTLTGFLLAEGEASKRLLRVFRALFGWIPGGTAVVCAVVCAFFTVFTGGSGVTILALGGLLFLALQQDAYRDGDHPNPGRQTRQLIQDRYGRRGSHDRYR